jgi:type I restriction enzyme M protein
MATVSFDWNSRLVTQETCEEFADALEYTWRTIRTGMLVDPVVASQTLLTFILIKWYEESTGNHIANPEDSETLLTKLNHLFAKSRHWHARLTESNPDCAKFQTIFDMSEIDCTSTVAFEVMTTLWPWNLSQSPVKARSQAYDSFISCLFKRELGQFSTPAPVAMLMVGLLQPTAADLIGDLAVGTGRTLMYTANHIFKFDGQQASPAAGFQDHQLYGTELNRNVAQIAYINSLMHGLRPYVCLGDSISKESLTIGTIYEEGMGEDACFPNELTAILVDPPFGMKETNEQLLQEYARYDGVAAKNGKVVKSISVELMFLARALEYLKPGGRLVVLLPEGMLSNAVMQYVRDWILRQAKLKAIVSLPQTTFTPFGASIKTSILALQKRDRPMKMESLEDERIYMARIDDIGYDFNGNPTEAVNEDGMALEVQHVIKEFLQKVEW